MEFNKELWRRTCEEKKCYICGASYPHKHHVFRGYNRKHSEKYGMIIYLCLEHHTGQTGVHNNKKIDGFLKENFQLMFEEGHSREEFIKIFGKSYIRGI